MLEMLITAVGTYIAFKLGQKSVIHPMRKLLDEIAQERGTTVEKLISEYFEVFGHRPEEEDDDLRVVGSNGEEELTIERVGEQYYAYGHTMGFLAQGKTFQSLFERILERIPRGSFIINKNKLDLSEEENAHMVAAIKMVFEEVSDETVK